MFYLNQRNAEKDSRTEAVVTQGRISRTPGKGSHTNWIHPLYAGKITVSGKDSADAKPYQEKEVLRAIQEVEDNQDDEQA
jgi:hypothetical protein